MHHYGMMFKRHEVTDLGVITGYASVPVEDLAGEIIDSGAFSETLKNTRRKVKMLWQHKSHEPIGVFPRLAETSQGLEFEGQLAMRTPMGQMAYELLKMEAVDGVSVGFTCSDRDVYKSDNVTRYKRVNLHEISIVTFPCNEYARVIGLKNDERLNTIRGVERFLRDAGFSIRVSKMMAAAWKNTDRDDSDDTALVAAISSLKNIITGA